MNTEWREIKRRWRENQKKKKRKHAHAKAFVSHSGFHIKHTHTWKWKYAAPHLPFFLLILFYLNSFFSFHSIPFFYIFLKLSHFNCLLILLSYFIWDRLTLFLSKKKWRERKNMDWAKKASFQHIYPIKARHCSIP